MQFWAGYQVSSTRFCSEALGANFVQFIYHSTLDFSAIFLLLNLIEILSNYDHWLYPEILLIFFSALDAVNISIFFMVFSVFPLLLNINKFLGLIF